MSCEQLREDIDKKRDAFAFGSNQRLTLIACKVVLDECCPSQRSRLTHTSKMLNAERDTLAEKNWQDAKGKVEALLEGIQKAE